MVEVGGEVRCGGKRSDGNPWRIAIDRPIESQDGLDQREMQAIVGISDAAICTSGNYRKFYEEDGIKRSHTISPFNGYPVQHGLLSATVHSVNASTADARSPRLAWFGDQTKESASLRPTARRTRSIGSKRISSATEGQENGKPGSQRAGKTW